MSAETNVNGHRAQHFVQDILTGPHQCLKPVGWIHKRLSIYQIHVQHPPCSIAHMADHQMEHHSDQARLRIASTVVEGKLSTGLNFERYSRRLRLTCPAALNVS